MHQNGSGDILRPLPLPTGAGDEIEIDVTRPECRELGNATPAEEGVLRNVDVTNIFATDQTFRFLVSRTSSRHRPFFPMPVVLP